jgi:hypothetical protein
MRLGIGRRTDRMRNSEEGEGRKSEEEREGGRMTE